MIFHVLWAIFALLPVFLLADQPQSPLHSIIGEHQNRIYILGETSGGSPEEWSELEAIALAKARSAISANPLVLHILNNAGATPLITASSNGHLGLVSEFLSHGTVKATVDVKKYQRDRRI